MARLCETERKKLTMIEYGILRTDYKQIPIRPFLGNGLVAGIQLFPASLVSRFDPT